MKKIFIFLMIILIIGGFLRFYKLTSVPPSLNWDEVAIGYNAYSIFKTGKDEFGKSFPKYFRSLDDYKRPVYIYVLVPIIGIFGLNDFTVRFPSALFGTFTIILIYLLVKEILRNKTIALLSAAILSILPWHIQFSRAAFEATLGIFFTALGVLLFLWGIRRNSLWFPFSAFSFGLALYSYLGQRGVVPIITVFLIVIFAKKLLQTLNSRKFGKISFVLFLFITLIFWTSLIIDMTGPEGTIRYKATNIFANNSEYDKNFQEIVYDGKQSINIPRRVFHNANLISFDLVTRGYLVHFSPDFFFFDLGQQHHHAPNMGLLYIWMLPFMMYGIYYLLRKYLTKEMLVVWIWLLATPLAASVTFQIPHALRVADMIMPISLIIAAGIYGIYRFVISIRRYFLYPFAIGVFLAALFFILRFYHQYFIHLPHERSKDWVYGREEMVKYAEVNKNKYEKIIVSTKLEFPHIFFLYFLRYDPQKYLSQGGTKSGSWDEEGNKYDKYEFHKFNFVNDKRKNLLFIGKPDEFPSNVEPKKIISYLDGSPAIYFVEGYE